MSIDNTVNDFLLGGGMPSAKFPTIGTIVKGIIESAVVTDQTDLDGNVRTWNDGNPRKQVVITLATDERDTTIMDDEGLRKLYVKGHMTIALREALKKAGAKSIEVGATLAVRYDSDGQALKVGHNAPKQYVAQYQAPVASISADDLI